MRGSVQVFLLSYLIFIFVYNWYLRQYLVVYPHHSGYMIIDGKEEDIEETLQELASLQETQTKAIRCFEFANFVWYKFLEPVSLFPFMGNTVERLPSVINVIFQPWIKIGIFCCLILYLLNLISLKQNLMVSLWRVIHNTIHMISLCYEYLEEFKYQQSNQKVKGLYPLGSVVLIRWLYQYQLKAPLYLLLAVMNWSIHLPNYIKFLLPETWKWWLAFAETFWNIIYLNLILLSPFVLYTYLSESLTLCCAHQ